MLTKEEFSIAAAYGVMLRRYRLSKTKMTQKELANLARIPTYQLSLIERGIVVASPTLIKTMAFFLKADLRKIKSMVYEGRVMTAFQVKARINRL